MAESVGGPTRGRRTLRPLAGVLTALAVSLSGTAVSAIALPWFALATTGSAARTGLVAFCEMTPYVVVKLLSGPLVDRTGPRTVSWTTDLVSALAAAAVPLLHALDLLSFPVLLVLVALIGAARGPGDLAKEVLLPEAAERGRVPLERAAGLSGVIERLAATVGPAAGGVLVALLGPLTSLAVNTACFVLGSLIIAVTLPRGMGYAAEAAPSPDEESRREPGAEGAPEEPEKRGEAGYWQRFGEGLAFLRGEPLLLTIVAMVGVTNLLDAGFSTVLLPVWARESDNGPAAIGLLGGTTGAAAVVGSLVAAVYAHRLRRRTVFFAGFLLAGAPRFIVLAADAPMGVVLAVFAVSGFGAGFLNPVLGAVLYERIPRRLLGRVNAVGDSVARAGVPLGGLLLGAAVTSAGLVAVLSAAGAAYFLTTSLAGLRREWRELDRPGRGAGREPTRSAHQGR
ncbi:MFS transporter [Streptomyces erythrochromogenes]|uniref:MFS transporter n=1 Tax=Streptomyces erythrochromogenes TaxID=285574 RepID=UPI0037F4446F